MIKLRLTQQFYDTITEARDIFGIDDNSRTAICKRAMRWIKDKTQSIPRAHGKGMGNPVTIDIETDYSNNEFMSIVIMYVQSQIEKSKRRVYTKFSGDNTVNFTINEGE